MKTEEIYILKKSIKWTAISLLAVSIFWFFFFLQAAYAYSPNGSPVDLKSGSRINAGAGSSSLFLQPGTGTSGGSNTARFRIVYGTQSTTGSGFTGFILPGTITGFPFIDYLFSNGSSTFNFSGFGAITIDGSTIGTSGALAGKLDSNGGVGTNNAFNSAQLTGSTTIGTGSTITAGSGPFDGTKVRFLADVTQNIEANINTKLTVIGTPTTYINMIQADGKTGTKSASFSAGSGMALTTTYQPDGALNFSYATSGSASAKPDIKEGGTITVTGAVFLNYNNADFDIAVNGLGADVDLSPTRKGTSTATASFTVAGGTDTGNLLKNWYNSGMVIGSAYGSTTVVTTTNAIIPDDATIPQNSEGSEIITVAYTPKQLGSTIHIQVIANVTPALSGVLTAAIFVDSVVGALCCAGYNKVSDDAISSPTVFSYSTTTASLATRTYKLRYGCSNASYIVYLNQGSVAGKTYGNIMLSSMHVYETKQ